MKKEISPMVMIGGVVAVLAVVGFFVFLGTQGSRSSQPSEMGKELGKILSRTNGDMRQMTEEELKIYKKAIATGYYRPNGSSGSAAAYAGSMQGSSGGGMSGSSGSSGGYNSSSGSSGGYNSSSGSSGGYPGQ